ncbi:MAG: hypothetical protein ACD_59C00022G0001 [uncultured bacterium]|uniref:DUF3006 domain-containing protein n=1 Tax=Candidatus Wallbacteria bacterium GWC2_49_35 TaxID=1817813 RepID=A0A1F7WJ87_9BACT|nr:MAG: hypothetical protein ACD_59C00022G0001 [uncultured bacterium]OGM02892.1 MAG: hypothetical protein A2008_07450 [Candidatus Wallbacteria bacterium GWC2_49_35]HBC74119.1 DUF3006 domain-containing protein [Candidatus Wallbacteria bacterium]
MADKHYFSAIVDRKEDDLVVLEMQFGHEVIIPDIYCPQGIGDGSVLKISIEYDREGTLKRRKEVEDMLKK